MRPLAFRPLSCPLLALLALLLAPPAVPPALAQDPPQGQGQDPAQTQPQPKPSPEGAPSPAPPMPGEPQPASGGGLPVPPTVQPAPTGPLTAPPTPPAPPPAASAGPPGEQLDFDLTFPAEQGGGSARGSARDLEYKRDDYAVLTGDVKIRYQDIELSADRAEIDLNTKVVTATGHVVVDQGPRRLTGETMTFDLDTKTGNLAQASAQVNPDYYFRGQEIAKVGEDTYTVTAGSFTSCNQTVPDWSFRLSRGRVEAEEYAHVRNATLRVKQVPVFYVPYILWPVKSDRTSGFLIPNFGYSDTRGAELGLAYYQTLGRSYDTTIHVDTYTKNYLGLGNELRYRPSEGTRGSFVGYVVHDPLLDDWRWKVELSHVTNDLPYGMRGVIAYQDFSDFNFFKDFERDFDRNTQRSIDSRAFASGSWGAHLLNVLVEDRDTFVGFEGDDVLQRRLPEIEYRLRSTRLGRTPFYLQMQSSADYLDIDRPQSYSGRYGRFDLFPQIMLPLSPLPWLSLSVGGGERVTWYGDTLDPAVQRFTGETRLRNVPFGSAEVVGPSFSRIYAGGGGRLKHVIQPRFTYTYSGDVDDPQEIPLFDEVDVTRAQNFGRVALSNRFLAKAAKPGAGGSAREFLLFEIARSYSFDDLQPLQFSRDRRTSSQSGPLEAFVRFNPTLRTSAQATVLYDTLFGGLSSTSLSGNFGFRGNDLGVTWFTRHQPESGETLSNQIRLSGALQVLPAKIRLEGQFNYDIEERMLQQQRVVATYTSQCYGLRLELRDFRAGIGTRRRDKDFRFSLSLKNVGTFLDLTGRSSTTEEP